ncbi:MAG: porin [Candidatus Fluviicola riflensis]|nr:MAG: porin [Candidatus Fluviicola riflensis]OGS76873.1 MAG: porin [Candidatus Fluviicola riflensis]OGS81803.1 MAG: porin [Fluviicola sp. RIFCSPHIGHO2_01_FULL_43_53]OGS88602.1 MAG: porin [Fluviicola sp. RIFCSPHIGHO2_12_FULL_43_24]
MFVVQLKPVACITGLLVVSTIGFSQQKPDSVQSIKPATTSSKWYDQFAIRGYMQVRYNRLLETNEKLKCEQCDKSWGEDGGFFIRRMRLIFYGQVSERVYFYVQPDFASSTGTTNHIVQLRDAYVDLGLDKQNQFRFRLGQSKVPYGFENMQSSQNRLPLDRNDPLNSALSNERDLGVFFYWAPPKTRKLFSDLVKDGLKGSGDYGVFALGTYNGQTANQSEKNNKLHVVSRLSYPFEIKNQVIEAGVQAYTGKFVLLNTSPGVKRTVDSEYLDQRVGASFILYPKPFGIQAEYNVGQGPEFNKQTDSIEVRNLSGGYITASYQLKLGKQLLIPFVRGQYYEGGKKHELDARSYRVTEYEIGFEWQPHKNFELVAMYTISSRRFEDYVKQDNLQTGRLLRIQAQLNF